MQSVSKIEIRGKVIFKDMKIIGTSTVANLNVVTEYLYTSKGEAKKESTVHRVEAWENTQVRDLTKIAVGSWVRIIGQYREKRYEKDGKKHSYNYIYADYCKMLPETSAEFMNKVELVGRLIKIDLNVVNNRTVGNMRVATDHIEYKNKEQVVESDFHNVEAWVSPRIKDLAKINPGTTVKVVGRYRMKTWKDKDGGERSRMEIFAEQFKKIAD